MKRPTGMPGQPCLYLGMFVGRIVVDDGVDHLSHGDLRLNRIEEADELLVPVALHVAADDGAVEHIEGGKQRRCAMAFVVVTSKNTPSARPANQIQIISLNLTTGSECDGAIGFL